MPRRFLGTGWHRAVPTGLRARLLLMVFAALLGSSLVILHTWYQQRRVMLEEMEVHVLSLTRMVALEDERLLGSTQSLLSVLALVPEVRAAEAPCGPLLWHILEAHPTYANLGVADARGRLVCSAIRTDADASVAGYEFFQDAMAHGQFAAGSYGIDRATGKAVVHFGQPLVGADGRRLGVVFASLELEWLDGFAQRVRVPEGSVITAYDHRGIVLARYPDPEAWVGRSISDAPYVQASFREKNGVVSSRGRLGGVLRVHAFTSLESGPAANPLFLSIGVPRDRLEEVVNHVLVRDLVLLWGVGAVALLLLYVAGNVLVVRPVERLVQVANRLGAGELGARSELPYGPDELGRLARSFDAMAGSLDAAVRTREEFLEVASHELKTPLASLKLQLQGALRSLTRGPALSPEQLRERLEFSERQVWRLGQLVEQMVDVKTVAEGGLHPALARVDLTALVRRVVGGLVPPMARPDTPVVVRGEEPVVGWWDAELLEKSFLHVLSNALKFGQGHLVEVTVRAEGPVARLAVKDQGIGIALEEQARVLERFARAVSTRHYGGFGMGLWLVQKMVGVMHGSLTLRSEPGRGTECVIELPREPRLPGPGGQKPEDGAESASMHLL